MKRPLLLFITLLLPLGITQAASRTWTATEPGDWYGTNNWNGGNLPGINDTVTFQGTGTAILSTGTVQTKGTTMPAGSSMLITGDAYRFVNAISLSIGSSAGNAATLTLAESGSLKVAGDINNAQATNSTAVITVRDNANLEVENFYTRYNGAVGSLLVSGNGVISTVGYPGYSEGDFSFGGLGNGAWFGTGNVTLQDHATIRAGGNVFFGSGTNTLNIESDQVKITTLDGSTPAVIQARGASYDVQPNGSGGVSSHTINFNHSGTLTFDNQLVEIVYEEVWYAPNETWRTEAVEGTNNTLAVHAISGVTKLTAANAHSRGTTVSDGATLIAANKYALGVGDVTVEADSTLSLALDAPAFQAFGLGDEDGDTFVIGGDLTVHGLLSLGLGDTVDIGGSLLLDGGLEIRFTDSADLDALTSLDGIFTVGGENTVNISTITATDGVETFTSSLTNGTLSIWETQPIPEPSTWFLLGAGLGGLALLVIHRHRESNLKI